MQTVQTVPALLLLEPDSLLRGTVASPARRLRLENVHEATSAGAAERLLELHRFEMLMMALEGDGLALQLLSDLRVAWFASSGNIPVAEMTDACEGDLIDHLKSVLVHEIVLKPSKAPNAARRHYGTGIDDKRTATSVLKVAPSAACCQPAQRPSALPLLADQLQTELAITDALQKTPGSNIADGPL